MSFQIPLVQGCKVTFHAPVHFTTVGQGMLRKVTLCEEPFSTHFAINVIVTHKTWVATVLQLMFTEVALKCKVLSTILAGMWFFFCVAVKNDA